MTVYDLPAVVLAAEDSGHPEADRDLLRGVPELGPVALYSDFIGKVSRLDPRDGVEGVALALTLICKAARSMIWQTASKPFAGGPRGFASVTSSRRDHSGFWTSGSPWMNAATDWWY
jgi:hypothetical protein